MTLKIMASKKQKLVVKRIKKVNKPFKKRKSKNLVDKSELPKEYHDKNRFKQ